MNISLNKIVQDKSEDLKESLLVDLRKPRPILNKFIVSLFRQKRLVINVNSNSENSTLEIDLNLNIRPTYIIEWGLADNSLNTIDREIFDFNSFNQTTLKQYRLLQQITICIFNELSAKNISNFNSIINSTTNLYLQDKKFYTFFGGFTDSIEHTQKPWGNDIAELFAIYLWDNNYFNRYFRFLLSQEEFNLSKKKAFSLRSLTPTTAKILEELISKCLQVYSPDLTKND